VPDKTRRYDLDWLRAWAVLMLIFFHSAMWFNEWPWHLKSPDLSFGLTVFTTILGVYQMPLLFLISGAGSWFALQFRSGGQYAVERLKRLVVPLVFGTFFIVPPQLYLERTAPAHDLSYGHSPLGQFHGSYFQWWPRHMFDGGVYPNGNFSWHHLWFLAYLFVLSLVLLPLFLRLKGEAGGRFRDGLAAWCARPGAIFLLALPPALAAIMLDRVSADVQSLWGDWKNLTVYGLMVVYGFTIFSQPDFTRALARHYKWAWLLALLTLGALALIEMQPGEPEFATWLRWSGLATLRALNAWCFILGLLGLAQRFLNFTNRALPYVNEAVLPVYVLHQTVILLVGVHVVGLHLPLILRYAMVSLGSLAATLALYEVLVRRLGVLRFLFGMKVGRKA